MNRSFLWSSLLLVLCSACWCQAATDEESSRQLEVLAKEARNPATRDEALASLREMGPKGATVLGELLKAKDQEVQEAAAWALKKMGPEAVPVLVKLLPDKDTRDVAAVMLGGMKPEAIPRDRDTLDAIQDVAFRFAGSSQDARSLGRAKFLLEKLLLVDSNRSAARRKLVEVAMAIGDHRGAKEHLEGHLLKEAPDDPVLLEQLGRCEWKSGNFQEAVHAFQKAIQMAPGHLEAYPPLAMVLREGLKNNAQADRVMEDLVQKNPQSAKAHFVRAAYLRATERTEEAFKEARRSLALNGKDCDAITLAAYCAMETRRYDEARKIAERGMELHKDQPGMYVMLAEVNNQTGKSAEAIEILRRGLEQTRRGDEKDGEILWRLATVLVDAKRLPEAEEAIREMREQRTPAPLLTFWESRIEIAKGNHQEARARLERVSAELRVRSPQVFRLAQYWIGQCWRGENLDKEIEAYDRALEIDPSFAPAKAAKADALARQGNPGEALKAGGGQLTPLHRARLMVLANLKLPKERRQWGPVADLLDAAEKEAQHDQDRVLILSLRAQMLAAQDQAARAENLAREFRDRHPEMIEPWRILASLAQRNRDWQKAEDLLNEAEAKVADKVLLHLTRAQLYARRNDKDAGKQLRGIVDKAERLPPDQQLQLWTGLVPHARQVGEDELARELCLRVAFREPNNVQIRYTLFEIGLKAKNDAAMAGPLEEIRKIAGEGAMWHYGQAVRLSTRKGVRPADFAGAIKHVEAAKQLQPNWSKLALLAGGLYDQQGHLDEALAEYIKAIEGGEQNPEAVRRVVAIYFQRRDYAEANAFLERLSKNGFPFTPETNRMRTEVLMQLKGCGEQAERQARDLVKDSNGSQDQLWLAGILAARGQQLLAEHQAGELPPEIKEAMAKKFEAALDRVEKYGKDGGPTLSARVLSMIVRSDAKPTPAQRKRIAKILAEWLKDYPGKREGVPLRVVLADLYSDEQRYDEAEKQYREVVALEPRNAVAYNNLAVLLALRKTNLDEALTFINRAIEILGPHPSMLDSRASVYLAMGRAEPALADLKKALADSAAPARLFHLARAQRMAGRTDEARATLARAESEAANLPGKKALRDLIEPLEQPEYDRLRDALK